VRQAGPRQKRANDMLILYLRSALASLRVNRVTTLINVVGLTLGMTCFVLAFAVAGYYENANGRLANAERIVVVQQRNVLPGDDSAALFSAASSSLAKYIPIEAPEVEAVARKTPGPAVQVGIGEQSLRLPVTFADPEWLRIIDYSFVDGDSANALEDVNSAVITAEMAELMFGTRNAAGRVFTINRRFDAIVRGVVETPDRMSVARLDILLNVASRDAIRGRAEPDAQARDEWSAPRSLNVNAVTLALLPRDGSLPAEELERRLTAVSDRIVLPAGGSVSFRVRPLKNHLGDTLTAGFGRLGIAPGISAIQLFFLPGILVLAMACFNYVNLATAIASTRAKEVGLSKVLGAESRDVVKKYFLEAVVAVVVSLAFALILGALGIDIVRNLSGMQIWKSDLATPEFLVLIVAIAAATSAAAGTYPAFLLSRFQPIEILRKGARRSGSSRFKAVFIGVQFAVASVLLTAVMVMYSHNAAMRAANLWRLPSDPLVQITTSLDSVNIDPDVFAAALLRAPQIKGVTGLGANQMEGGEADLYSRSGTAAEATIPILSNSVSYDFFSTLGVDLVAGRPFARGRDLVSTAARGTSASQSGALGVVIDLEAVRALGWSTAEQALGQIVHQHTDVGGGRASMEALALEIIGVVDRAPLALMTIGTKATAFHLDPYATHPIVRIDANDVQAGIAHIQNVWRDLTGSVPGDSLRSPMRLVFLDDLLDEALRAMNGLTTALLTVVVFGFLVALAGIFGMALFIVTRRRHEIGIRKSLGAGSKEILRQLIVEFGKPVLIGNVIAWPIGYVLAGVYIDWFVERMSFTPWPFVLSLAITLALAWVGVGGQALKAARLVPARVLRDE
jgi:putative ABC transport system permease protein